MLVIKSFCWRNLGRALGLLPVLALVFLTPAVHTRQAGAQVSQMPDDPGVQGPFVAAKVIPYEYRGSLLDLKKTAGKEQAEIASPQPLKYTPNTYPKGSAPALDQWIDPVLQDTFAGELMPGLIKSFAGMSYGSFGGGNGWPPDPNGDVGPAHYIQAVNTSLAIFDKASGSLIIQMWLNDFFNGTNTPCDYQNSGDPVVIYDRFEDRWLVSDFSLAKPYYECIAISKTGDPVNGGWYMYGVPISDSLMNDYPKVGIWRDAYFFTFNMFTTGNPYTWRGVQVWAFEKNGMLNGQPVKAVSFALGQDTGYESLLPAHALTLPPAGTPEFFTSVSAPNKLFLWKFKPDWSDPVLSTFTGPQEIEVANFAAADSIEQPGTTTLLDSLSPRPMMQLMYRSVNSLPALWMTHTVTNRGTAGMRWYELRQPADSPVLYQQGTYQPDNNHRWMGSLAVDRDGNMALGYSIASNSLYPGIRYTGRLAGEALGKLPQGERVLVNGTGAQYPSPSSGGSRWGDYSSMSVDPQDECTFWYTNEYYLESGINWQTRIGAFKFSSCGQPKGSIQGVVRNAITNQPVANVPVMAKSDSQQMSVLSSTGGAYTITLGAGTYSVTAGPLDPGYPTPVITSSIELTAGHITSLDILLSPVPNLVEYSQVFSDSPPGGNQNGFLEPGEYGLQLQNTLLNNGAITSTIVTASLQSLTPGIVITQSLSQYPDIQAGQTAGNLVPYTFSVSNTFACGDELVFRKIITDSLRTYTETFSLPAAIQLERRDLVNSDMESGDSGWSSGGVNNTWAISTTSAHSPVHAWTDSPRGNYLDNSDSWLVTPVFDLHNLRGVQIKFWTRYALESGYDYVYLEYSTDGGRSWVGGSSALEILNGVQKTWKEYIVPAPQLDKQSSVRLRFRLVTDAGVTLDGIYLDDFSITYTPFACLFGKPVLRFPLIFK